MKDKYFKIYISLFKACGFLGCHQLPQRSFHIGNWQLPICARCTGVFIGQLIMIIYLLLGFRTPIKIDIIFLFIMFADWFIQYLKILSSTNIRRLITGILAGFAITSIYYKIIIYVYYFIVSLF